tara:strand:+ start:2736 stop:2855 length:120 start_codon:yes stop_codon:yes gene_type:complete
MLNSKRERLSWYEEKSEQPLSLIHEIKLPENAAILNIGF